MHVVEMYWAGFYTGIGVGVVIGAVGLIVISIIVNLSSCGKTPRPDKNPERLTGGGR